MNIKAKTIKRFILINLGLFIMTLGLVLFLVPSNLAVGGVAGLAMIINVYFPQIDLGLLVFIFNAILITLSFFLIGKDFGGYTIYCSVAMSFMISMLQKVMTHYNIGVLFPDDLMLTLIIGIIVCGSGMAIVFYQNASTGGTDIVAKIINKYAHIDIGKSLFLADSLITLGAGIVFSPRIGVYAFLGILLNSVVIDKIIAGFDIKSQSLIISGEHRKILEYIINELDRGATCVKVRGGYSEEEKNMINVVLSRREYIRLKNYVREIDPRAFITMHYTHEVLGEGFDLESPVPSEIINQEQVDK